MTELEALGTAALALFLGAISPGPSLAVVVRATIQGGRTGGIFCAVGHGLGFAIYALAVVFGLAAVMTQYPTAFAALQCLGVGLLMFLAYKSWFASSGEEAPLTSASGHFSAGFFIAFLNPKIALFFLAVFAAVLQPNMQTNVQLTIAAMGWFIDTAWYVIVAVGLSAPRAVRVLKERGLWIDRVMALVLLGLAATTVARLMAPVVG